MKSINQLFLLSALGVSFLLPNSTYASITRTYHFPPNQPVTIQNPLYWDLDTHCKISSDDQADRLEGTMIHKSGLINGIKLKQGQNISVTVHPNEDFHLQAEYKAVVQIINYGNSTVSAKCRI